MTASKSSNLFPFPFLGEAREAPFEVSAREIRAGGEWEVEVPTLRIRLTAPTYQSIFTRVNKAIAEKLNRDPYRIMVAVSVV